MINTKICYYDIKWTQYERYRYKYERLSELKVEKQVEKEKQIKDKILPRGKKEIKKKRGN